MMAQSYARDEAGNIWEVDEQGNPVRLAQPAPARQGRVYTDPTQAREQERKDEDQGIDRRRVDLEAERVRLDQERARLEQLRTQQAIDDANRGTIPEGMQLINGQLSPIPGFVSDRDAQGRINALIGQINEVQRLFNTGPGTTRGVAGVRDFVPGGDNSRFDKAAAGLEDIATAAFKVPGMGAQSDADAARLAAAVKPNRWAYDEATDQQLKDIRRRVDEWLKARGMAAPSWEAPIALDAADPLFREAQRSDEAGQYTPEYIAAYRARYGSEPPPYGARAEQGSFGDSYFAQGMSGINTGIGNALGAPVDLVTTGLNLIPQGINFLTNSNLPTIENPVGGSDWWNRGMETIGSIQPETNDPNMQFVRRVGESVGSAAVPVGAAANSGRQLVAGLATSLAGGLGGATAQQAAPGNIIAEILAETAAGGLTGARIARKARNVAQREIESRIPTVRQLKDEAGDLYQAGESGGRTATPQETTDLADRFRNIAVAEGLLYPNGNVAEAYPKAKEALRMTQGYSGGDMTPKQMNVARKSLSEAAGSNDPSERRIAKALLGEFDDWSASFAPEFSLARNVSRRYLNAEELENMRGQAEAAASQFGASGLENALRTQYRALDKSIERGSERGWPLPVQEAIRDVSRGTPASNIARGIGRLAPTTPWSFTTSAAIPAALGTALGGPTGGLAATALTTGLGTAGRVAATNMGVRNAEVAELIARNGGPISQAPLLDPDTQRIVAALLAAEGVNYSNQAGSQ